MGRSQSTLVDSERYTCPTTRILWGQSPTRGGSEALTLSASAVILGTAALLICLNQIGSGRTPRRWRVEGFLLSRGSLHPCSGPRGEARRYTGDLGESHGMTPEPLPHNLGADDAARVRGIDVGGMNHRGQTFARRTRSPGEVCEAPGRLCVKAGMPRAQGRGTPQEPAATSALEVVHPVGTGPGLAVPKVWHEAPTIGEGDTPRHALLS